MDQPTTHTSYPQSEPGRPAVSLAELQRAWEAVQAGRFRTTRPGAAAGSNPPAPSEQAWYPAETVVPVLGAGGGVGTTSLTLALASASPVPARVVEGCSATASGLSAASTAELGAGELGTGGPGRGDSGGVGWRRGLREGQHHRILLERAAQPIPAASAVPLPTHPDRPVGVTFLDCGWELDHLLASAWIGQQVIDAECLVLVARATIPGLRRLEATLETLHAHRGGADRGHAGRPDGAAVAGVLGPRRRKWSRAVEGSLGPATRGLGDAQALVQIPVAKSLAAQGLTAAPLPPGLLKAASRLLDHLPRPATPISCGPAAQPDTDIQTGLPTDQPDQPDQADGTGPPPDLLVSHHR